MHRDLAYVSALRGDLEAYTRHAEQMRSYYESTRNPLLMQQCAALRSQASELGILAGDQPGSMVAENDAYELGTTVVPDAHERRRPKARA